jgi:hypothetical protein
MRIFGRERRESGEKGRRFKDKKGKKIFAGKRKFLGRESEGGEREARLNGKRWEGRRHGVFERGKDPFIWRKRGRRVTILRNIYKQIWLTW